MIGKSPKLTDNFLNNQTADFMSEKELNQPPKKKLRYRWTKDTEEYLYSITRAEISIIECKRSDKNMDQKKKEAWARISAQMNDKFGTNLTSEQCSEKWRAHKRSIKEHLASERQQAYQTGNKISPTDTKLTAEEQKSFEYIGPDIKPINIEIDSDKAEPVNSVAQARFNSKDMKDSNEAKATLLEYKKEEHLLRMKLIQREFEEKMSIWKTHENELHELRKNHLASQYGSNLMDSDIMGTNFLA